MKLVQKERLLIQQVLPIIEGGANTFAQMKKHTSLPDYELRIVISFGLKNWVRTGVSTYQKLEKTSPKTYNVLTNGR